MLNNFSWRDVYITHRRHVVPALGLLVLILISVVGFVHSTTFELTKLSLDNKGGFDSNYQQSILKAVEVHDYETAEILLSFFQATYDPLVTESVNYLIYPERHVSALIDRWDTYQESHPISTPVLLQQVLLMWQLGDMFGVSRLASEALEIDPHNQDALMVMKYMSDLQ